MAVTSNKVIKRETKTGIYVLIRRNFHGVEVLKAFTTKRDVDIEKNKLDKEFEDKKRNFDYYEIHKIPLILNSRTKNKK